MENAGLNVHLHSGPARPERRQWGQPLITYSNPAVRCAVLEDPGGSDLNDGRQERTVDVRKPPGGVYILQLKAGRETQIQKLTVVR